MHADRSLQYSDISFDSSGKILSIQIRKSIIHQTGKVTKVKIYPPEKGTICCVQSVLEFMNARPRVDDYLLYLENRPEFSPKPVQNIMVGSIWDALAIASTYLALSHAFQKTSSYPHHPFRFVFYLLPRI